MKKMSIFKSLGSKKFKYGGYATLITAVVIVLLIVVNLIASTIPATLDLTADKKYSLSEQTINTLKKVKDEITIYNVHEHGQENPMTQYFQIDIESILNRYKQSSNNIILDEIDPVRDASLAGKYTETGENLMTGSLIVVSGDKYRVITPMDMIDQQTANLLIEQRITSAISFVIGEDSPIVYMIQGHNEIDLVPTFATSMELENFIVKEVNLMASKGVPEDASMILLHSPQSDITEEEVDYLTEYLENEGRAIFIVNAMEKKLENLDTVLKSYGVTLKNHYVVETVEDRYAGNYPVFVVPEILAHEITNPMLDVNELFVMPSMQGIEILDTKKRSLTVEPLLVSSDKSFGIPLMGEKRSYEKQEGDIDGPFNLAIAITDNIYNMPDNTMKTTKLVVIGGVGFEGIMSNQSTNLFMNSLNWLHERQESIAVRPKSLKITPLNITEAQKRVYYVITITVIPLVILAAGLVVWLRRRHL